MTTLEQVPFNNMEFADNPEPRCACLLLLDTSGSMQGIKIQELNTGLSEFARQLRADAMAAKRVEVGIVTFGPVHITQPFVTADAFTAPKLQASGETPMGAAIEQAAGMIADRKQAYRANGVGYYRPWIFMISDGTPTDDITYACTLVKEGEAQKRFLFYAVGVEGADMAKLAKISVREPLRLKQLSFAELFVWLSDSLSSVSRSQTSDSPALKDPTAPDGWAVAG